MATDEIMLDDLGTRRAPQPCKVAAILDKLGTEERQRVQTALDGHKEEYPHSKIAAALSKRVWPVSDHAIAAHRSGACTCGR